MTSRDEPAPPGLRLLDYVFVLRPANLVPLWLFYLNGARLAMRTSDLPLGFFHPSGRVLVGFAAMTAVLGFGYLANQIADVETDRLNRKLHFLPSGLISLRSAWTEAALLVAVAAGLSVWVTASFRWALAAALVLNMTYSLPPVRAKAKAPCDIIWNALGFGIVATLAGASSAAGPSAAIAWRSVAYALAVGGVFASSTILDISGDRALGLRTSAVSLGERRTGALSIALLSAAAVTGAIARDGIALFGSALSLPLMVWAHMTGERAHRIAAGEVSVGVFALLVGLRCPALLALLALVYFGSRGYYRARFGVCYPGPGPREVG